MTNAMTEPGQFQQGRSYGVSQISDAPRYPPPPHTHTPVADPGFLKREGRESQFRDVAPGLKKSLGGGGVGGGTPTHFPPDLHYGVGVPSYQIDLRVKSKTKQKRNSKPPPPPPPEKKTILSILQRTSGRELLLCECATNAAFPSPDHCMDTYHRPLIY